MINDEFNRCNKIINISFMLADHRLEVTKCFIIRDMPYLHVHQDSIVSRSRLPYNQCSL